MPFQVRFTAKPLAALACALLLGTSASIAAQEQQTFAGPSVVRPSDDAQFTGRGFAPNSQVTIVITVPAGDELRDRAAVAEDGTFTVAYSAQAPGRYVLTVVNDAGETLASAQFVGME